MKAQVWGTYSVRDHLRERPFVADVLLFDKLVIPRPATQEELYSEGERGPIVDQMERWRDADWDPDAQRKLLDVLKEHDLAIELPWGGKAQYDWKRVYENPAEELECDRTDFTQSIQDQIQQAKSGMPEEAAYIGTGGVIAMYVANKMQHDVARKLFNRAKTPGIDVEPVIAYGSYQSFEREQTIIDERDEPDTPSPYAMFGWEFFVPEDSAKSDAEVLREAAKLASRPDFCETRQAFHGWLKLMYEAKVDQRDAYNDMMKMLAEYQAIMRKQGWATSARYAAKVAKVVAPLVGLIHHSAGEVAGAAVGAGAFAVENLIPMPQVPQRLQSAAVLYDARKFFGKR